MQTKFKQFIFSPLSRFGISQKLQATALWSMLESFSNPFFTLLLIPIFTRNLGLESYGVYVIVIAFLSLSSFCSLGMSTSITYYLAVNNQNSDLNSRAERIGAALLISLLGTAFFLLTILLSYFFFMQEINKLFPQLLNYKTIILVTLALLISTQLDVVMSAALKGLRFFEASSKLEFFIRLFSFFMLSIVAIISKSLIMVIHCLLLLSLLNLTLRYSKLAKLINFSLTQVKLNKESTVELLHFGKWMTLQNISGAIFGSLDKLVLVYFTNATIVGTYNILISVTQLSHYFLANASSFISPKIAASQASMSALKQKYIQSLVISILITIFIAIISIAIYPLISSYFGLSSVRKEYFILLAGYGILATCVPPYYFALGFGKVKLLSNINALSALVGIFCIFLLVEKYGMLGAAVSRLIYTIFVTVTFLIPALIFKKYK